MTARFFIFRILLAVLLLAGCTRFGDSPVEPANDGRDLVPVNFTLAVAPEEDGTSSSFAGLTGESPATKTDYEPDTWGDGGKNDAIKTVLFLQFEWQDGTEASARLIGQQFIQYGVHANLLASNAKNTVLVIANMGGKIDVSNGITLGNFLEKYNDNRIASLDDIWYVSGGNRYLRMSGSKVLNSVTPNDTDLGSVSLRRNCAKVVVKLKNIGSATVAVDKVMLRDVNKKYYYVTNYTGFTDPYQPENPQRFDLAAQLYPSEGVEGTGGDAGYRIYTYYIPANVRGSITNTGQ